LFSLEFKDPGLTQEEVVKNHRIYKCQLRFRSKCDNSVSRIFYSSDTPTSTHRAEWLREVKYLLETKDSRLPSINTFHVRCITFVNLEGSVRRIEQKGVPSPWWTLLIWSTLFLPWEY